MAEREAESSWLAGRNSNSDKRNVYAAAPT
jgi:hypothetical protein